MQLFAVIVISMCAIQMATSQDDPEILLPGRQNYPFIFIEEINSLLINTFKIIKTQRKTHVKIEMQLLDVTELRHAPILVRIFYGQVHKNAY